MVNFKKISAIAAGVLMTGLTMGTAVAANYPAPFVSGGAADVAIVYGTGDGVSALDVVEAGNIQSNLQSYMGSSDGSASTSTSVTGDSIQIEKSTNSFNLGNDLNGFYTTIDGDELGTILADGTYSNEDNEEFDYNQEVVLGSKVLTHFTDNDFNDEKPSMGFAFSGGDTILNYTLDFSPTNAEGGTNWDSLEGTTIEMLGKEYYVLSATNASTPELDLLDSANSGVVDLDETITIETDSNSYEVSIVVVEDDDTAKLRVDGEITPSLDEDDTYKLDSGDYIGIKNVIDADFQGDTSQVEFSIGSGKIELVDGEEIEVNGEDVSDIDEYEDYVLNAYITPGGTTNEDLDKFTLEWKLVSGNAGDKWLAFDTDSTELVMPVFNNLKLSLGNFITEYEEVTSVEPDGDDSFVLDTTVTDGDVSINLLYANSSKTGFEGIGESATEILETNSSANPKIYWDENSSYFVATWIDGDDAESYVLEVSDIAGTDEENATTITSLASGSNEAITIEQGESDEIGQITFTLDGASESSETANITLTTSGSGTVTADKLVTAEGMKIQLPQDEDVSAAGGINFTVGADTQTAWTMNFTEETESGSIDAGESFNITLGFNSAETTVSSVSVTDYETEDGSDDYVGYVVSDLATMTMFYTGGDQDNIDITYHGAEATAEVFLSELSSTISSSSSTSGASQLGDILAKDSEVSSVSSKNLIVVGGSCINSAAATLLGGAYCGASFTDETGVGSGEYIIKGYSDSSLTSSGKVALLVAGYEAADTVNAATYLRNQMPDTGSEYIGTSASSAVEQTA